MQSKLSHRIVTSIAVAVSMLASVAFGASGDLVVLGDFGLIDHQGRQHTLSRFGYNKAIVVITQSNSCSENVDLMPKYKLLRETWEKQGIEFLMMNSQAGDDLSSIRRFASTWNVDFPIMVDHTQLVAESLEVRNAGEILVIDPNSRLLLYRGPLNPPRTRGGNSDASAFDERVAPPTLEEVLAGVVSGEVKSIDTPTVRIEVDNDCALSFPEQVAHAESVPDYAADVAPILMENCARCHVEGGIGPFAMNRYLVVRGFAPMIREVLMTKRMPPMQVDPHFNHFQNASYLTDAELKTLVHWIDAGAPRGDNPEDPLLANAPLPAETEWQFGTPDFVVDIPAYDVPAAGVIDYFTHSIDLPFAEDKYVRAVQFIPGDRRVLHHLLAYIRSPEVDGDEPVDEENVRDFLEGYAPGKYDATPFPEGTGVFIPKGYRLTLSMHYTTIGVPVTDRTRLGLYFHDEPPPYKYLTYSISHGGRALEIEPGDWDHRMNNNYLLEDDIVLYAMRPHMHFRGKAFRFSVVYPDQTTEVLMNVPNYNFNWQPTYRLTEPKYIPAGSRIVTDGVFDNSVYNRGVPDPNAVAKGGPQTWDEMFIGYITYTLPNNPQNRSVEEVQVSAVSAR